MMKFEDLINRVDISDLPNDPARLDLSRIDLSDLPDDPLHIDYGVSERPDVREEPPPFDIDGMLTEFSRLSPELQALDPDASFADVIYPWTKPFMSVGYTAAAAVNRGAGMFAEHLDLLSEYVEEKTGYALDTSGDFYEKAAQTYEDNAKYWQERAQKIGPSFLEELFGEAIGGAVPGIAEFLLNIPYHAALGAAEAGEEGKSELAGALMGATERGILGLVFRAMGPLKQYLRAPAMGTIFGLQTAKEEGAGPREIAKGLGTGAIYSLSSPGGMMGLNEIRRNLRTEMSKREATLEQNKRVVRESGEGKEQPEGEGPKRGETGTAKSYASVSAGGKKPPEVIPPKRPMITQEQKKRAEKAKQIKETQLAIESAEQAENAVVEAIRQRRYNLNLAAYETNLFVNSVEQVTTRQQREVLPFIIERTDIPKRLKRPDIKAIYAEQRANLEPIAEQVRKHFDEGWEKMKAHIPDMSAEQIENYVTHIWNVPRSKRRMVSNWFVTQNRFLKKRYIETLKEGIDELGLTPKVLDIAEIIRVHDSVMNRAIENSKFVEFLSGLKYEGAPLIERADKAPQDWVYFDHPALRRTLVIPGEAKMGEKISPELRAILEDMGVAIGRRISPTVFGKPSRMAGQYRPGDPPEVRFQRFMENSTIAHEIGHHIDSVLRLGEKFLNDFKTELYALNRERIEASKSEPGKYGIDYTTSAPEQIAELFAFLFTKPEVAYERAPNATKYVLERLKEDGTLSRLLTVDFEKSAKNLIEEQLNTMIKLPVKVHPDLVKPLRVVFDSNVPSQVAAAYDTMNGILKKAKLSISLFHHVALGETGVAIMGPGKVGEIYFNPVKIYNALVNREFDVFEKEPIARDAISHGLQVGATADIPVHMIQAKLNNLARMTKNIPFINRTTEFVRTFNETWDRALWDYLHDTQKLYAYEALVSKIDPARGGITKQKREIAQFVNDTFGGQNWDTLMVSPQMIRFGTRTLLSLDWTVSTVRQALAPTGIGKIYDETAGLRRSMGQMFWVKAALYFGVGMNMLNAAFRTWDEKKYPHLYEGENRTFMDRTMFGNTTGRKTYLFVGRYDDRSERYLRWGKQFRELPELFYDDTGFSPATAALKKVGGKTSPNLQLATELFTGVSPSGFKNDDIFGESGWQRVWGIAQTLVAAPLPFSVRAISEESKEWKVTDIAMPSTKGMTRYRAVQLFKHAIAESDERMLKEVYQETLRNNLPAYSIFKTSLTILKAEATREFNDGIEAMDDIQKRLAEVESPADMKRIENILKRMLKESEDRQLGIRLLDKAIIDLRAYEITK